MRRARRVGFVALAVSACGGSIGAGAPLPSAGFRPGDRVVIGDFSAVLALAATSDRVYVVYPSAVAIRLAVEQRWDVPRSPPVPDALRRVTGAFADPVDRSLWMIAGTQWIHYDPFANHWDQGVLPGTATAIVSDAADPGLIWFRTSAGWANIPRIGGVAVSAAPPRKPVPAPTIDDAYRDLPQLRGLVARVVTGPLLRQGLLTAAAPDPLARGWYLGTSNRGLVFFDRTAADATPIPLGLPASAVGAITAGPTGVWVETDADAYHAAAVSLLPDDLGSARWIMGSPSRGMPFTLAQSITAIGDTLWLGTDQGAVRISATDESVERVGIARGVSDQRTFAIAAWRGSIVSANARGIAAVHGDSGAVPLWPSFNRPAYALATRGDTLWIGADFGLFAAVPGIDEPRMPEGFRQFVGNSATVLAIGYAADTLVAVTNDRLLWRDPATGAWSAGFAIAGPLGTIATAYFADGGVWVGGTLGVGFVRPTTPLLRTLSVPNDLPDQVTSITEHGRYLWIGTRSGLVRFALEGR